MQNHNIAKLIAARMILSLRDIESDRVTLDKYNHVVVDGRPVKKRDSHRIGVLKHVILGLASDHEQPDVTDMLFATRAYKADAMWAFTAFGSALIGLVGYYQHCRERGGVVPV